MNNLTYYDILEVKENASQEVIKGAYRFLSQKHHPDKNIDVPNESERYSAQLNEAYSTLSNHEKRQEYDKNLSIKLKLNETSNNKESTVQPNNEKQINNHSFAKRVALMTIFVLSFAMLTLGAYQIATLKFKLGYILGVILWGSLAFASYRLLFKPSSQSK